MIVQKENQILRQKAREVMLEEINTPEIKKIISDMTATLASSANGVAIAAPQIGISLRISVIAGMALLSDSEKRKIENECQKELETLEKENGKKHSDENYDAEFYNLFKKKTASLPAAAFINPAIVKISKKIKLLEEGCLSVNGFYGKVKRADKLTVEALDENGKKISRNCSGLLAQIIQHEVDHLNGILFIDKAEDLKKAK